MADKPEGGSWGVIRYVPSPTSLPTDKVEVEIPAFLDGWFARQDEALGGVDTYRIHKTIAARVTTAW